MVTEHLKRYLEKENIKYEAISHPLAYTAQDIAASAHIPGREVAKTVMVKIDGKMAMAVLPATLNINFELLKQVTGGSQVSLANEREFEGMFLGCDVGAMPPFGHLYGMDVFVTESLAENREIAFNAGSHEELIKMTYSDYQRLVRPKVGDFCKFKPCSG